VHNVHQTQKKKDGQNITCGSCYGAESEQYKCCNTCDDVSTTDCGCSMVSCNLAVEQHQPLAAGKKNKYTPQLQCCLQPFTTGYDVQLPKRLLWCCMCRAPCQAACAQHVSASCFCLPQVREAYQTKGWVLNNMHNIEQCKDDGYLQMINEQQGEGCHMWGHLSVSCRQAGGS
jgi:hypothetical protein